MVAAATDITAHRTWLWDNVLAHAATATVDDQTIMLCTDAPRPPHTLADASVKGEASFAQFVQEWAAEA